MPNVEKENALKAEIKNVFAGYISADKARIKKNKELLKKLNSLDGIFSNALENLDSEVAYYKGKIDKKWKVDKNRTVYNADEQEDSITEILEEIKMQYSVTINKDKTDIEKAQELCKKMQDCVEKIFSNGLQETKKTQIMTVSVTTENTLSDT